MFNLSLQRGHSQNLFLSTIVVVQVCYGRGSRNAKSDSVQYVHAATAKVQDLSVIKVYIGIWCTTFKQVRSTLEGKQAQVRYSQEFLLQMSNAFLLTQVFFVNVFT